MKVALFDRESQQAVALIFIPDHQIPRPPFTSAADLAPRRFEVEVTPELVLEPLLDLRRVTLFMEGREVRVGWCAVPAGAKSNAIVRLALYDRVEGIDEVKPQHRPAAREALRRHFHIERTTI